MRKDESYRTFVSRTITGPNIPGSMNVRNSLSLNKDTKYLAQAYKLGLQVT